MQVVSLTGEKVGKISKQWSGFAREVFTDADFFGITFPLDLDVRMKAVLLGATFLIVSIVLIVYFFITSSLFDWGNEQLELVSR